jgi:hypothetical protein
MLLPPSRSVWVLLGLPIRRLRCRKTSLSRPQVLGTHVGVLLLASLPGFTPQTGAGQPKLWVSFLFIPPCCLLSVAWILCANALVSWTHRNTSLACFCSLKINDGWMLGYILCRVSERSPLKWQVSCSRWEMSSSPIIDVSSGSLI